MPRLQVIPGGTQIPPLLKYQNVRAKKAKYDKLMARTEQIIGHDRFNEEILGLERNGKVPGAVATVAIVEPAVVPTPEPAASEELIFNRIRAILQDSADELRSFNAKLPLALQMALEAEVILPLNTAIKGLEA